MKSACMICLRALLGTVLLLPGMSASAAPGEAVTSAHPAGFRQVAETHWVSGHVDSPGQVAQLARDGIAVVISLLPADEQRGFDEAEAVKAANMRFVSIPVTGAADLTRANVTALDQALRASAGSHTLIHCASGNRVGALMALRAAWIDGQPREVALATGKRYGMTRLEPAVADLLPPADAGASGR